MINLIPASRTALVIDGDALLVVRTKLGPFGPEPAPSRAWTNFLTAPIDTLRGRLRGETRDTSSELVLVLPASWCASRPVPIDAKSWKHRARGAGGTDRGVLPLRRVRRAHGRARPLARRTKKSPRGAMFVAPKREAEPWRERVAQVFGRPVDEVIASTMALPALGLQTPGARDDRDRARHAPAGDDALVGTTRGGRRALRRDGRDAGDLFTWAMRERRPGAQKLSMEDLAAAAGRLPFVPGVRYRALGSESPARGSTAASPSSRRSRWSRSSPSRCRRSSPRRGTSPRSRRSTRRWRPRGRRSNPRAACARARTGDRLDDRAGQRRDLGMVERAPDLARAFETVPGRASSTAWSSRPRDS